MNCANSFCIYQLKGKCMIENISIDYLGMCAECIYPDMDEEILRQAKLKLLKKYEEQDKE
ncbi:MAG: hypothetical protein IKL10_02415 [Clostridia bacterium]|nr:hypothetical protein [Clostridia bacterium]